MLLDALPLLVVLRTFDATRDGHVQLYTCAVVCKDWHRAVAMTVADLGWKSGAVSAGQAFLDDLPFLQHSRNTAAIVRGMHQCMVLKDATMQEHALFTLNYVLRSEILCRANRGKSVAAALGEGGVSTTLAAMQLFPHERELHCQGFGVLLSLATKRPGNGGKWRCRDNAVCAAVVKAAMRRFSGELNVQQIAFKLLVGASYPCWSTGLTELCLEWHIMETGVLATILPTMLAHEHELDDLGLELLRLYALNQSANWHKITGVGPGAIAAILDLLVHNTNHNDGRTVQVIVVLLQLLASNTACVGDMMMHNAVSKCVRTVRVLSPLVQAPAPLAAGAADVQVSCNKTKLQLTVCRILQKILWKHHGGTAQRVAEEGGIMLLVDMLRMPHAADKHAVHNLRVVALFTLKEFALPGSGAAMLVQYTHSLAPMLALLRSDTCTYTLFAAICRLLYTLAVIPACRAPVRAEASAFAMAIRTKHFQWLETGACARFLACVAAWRRQ